MMDENQVIEALKGHFAPLGFALVSQCSTTMQGIDLVMAKENLLLWIEAKGDTSSRDGSNRFGKLFTDTQCHVHYSRAFFKACEMRDKAKQGGLPVRIAMAFAHTDYYQRYFDRTNGTRKELGISVFWVKAGGIVEEV